MPDLTELELEHIRQIIFLNENKYQKINIYLSQIQDIQVQQMFNNIKYKTITYKFFKHIKILYQKGWKNGRKNNDKWYYKRFKV